MCRIINLSKDTVLADKVEFAKTWFRRLKGLLFRDGLMSGQCLVIYPCNAVHTCFMKFSIDLLFVSKSGEVVFLMENVHPFKFSPVVKGARYVLECPSGTVNSTRTEKGDRLTPLSELIG